MQLNFLIFSGQGGLSYIFVFYSCPLLCTSAYLTMGTRSYQTMIIARYVQKPGVWLTAYVILTRKLLGTQAVTHNHGGKFFFGVVDGILSIHLS